MSVTLDLKPSNSKYEYPIYEAASGGGCEHEGKHVQLATPAECPDCYGADPYGDMFCPVCDWCCGC